MQTPWCDEYFMNINQFEELAFASSNFSMPKNTLKHVLLAEELHDQSSDSKDTVNEAIPGAHIEVEEKKESLLSKITKKISDFFKPKPKVYRLGNNESLEIDGEVPGNSVGGFFSKILAIEILCFCPPDKRIPLSPTIVSYFCGKLIIKS